MNERKLISIKSAVNIIILLILITLVCFIVGNQKVSANSIKTSTRNYPKSATKPFSKITKPKYHKKIKQSNELCLHKIIYFNYN